MHHLNHSEPCPDCGRFANRGLTIDAVIIKDGKLLLVKRGAEPFKGFWATPGGFVEWDETVEDAVAREVKEETGLTVKRTKLVGVFSSPSRHPKQVITIFYLAETEDGTAIAGDDADDVQWFALDNLPEQLAFDHEQLIAASLELEQTT